MDKLSLEAVGWLLPVLSGDKSSTAEVAAIRQLLNNRAEETAATAHFTTSYADEDYLLLNSDRRSDAVILDGKHDYLGTPWRVRTVIKGDQACIAVAAASVIAKVRRDAMMAELGPAFAAFDFAANAGYPSPTHRIALEEFGPTPHHRVSWSYMDALPRWRHLKKVRITPEAAALEAGGEPRGDADGTEHDGHRGGKVFAMALAPLEEEMRERVGELAARQLKRVAVVLPKMPFDGARPFELGVHALELGDHGFDLRHLAALFVEGNDKGNPH